MAKSKIFLAFLLYYMTSISAISLPVSLHMISINNSFPKTNPLRNESTNLVAPSPPPGFSTLLKFNSSIQLKPLEVYVCIIELMRVLANFAWSSLLPVAIEMAGHEASTEIELNPFPPDDTRLQMGYAVLGLYKVGVAIAQGNKFFELYAAFYMGDSEVGWLEIRPKGSSLHVGSNNQFLPLSSHYTNDTTTMMANSATIFDPEDNKFGITFTWDGARIKAQDIFTVVLDAFAIAAEHNNTDLDANIPAARSASGDTVLSTWTAGEGESTQMTWARLKRALILMWDILLVGPKGQKPRFEGLMFQLEYEGKGIGAGRMLRFDEAVEGAGGSAVEK